MNIYFRILVNGLQIRYKLIKPINEITNKATVVNSIVAKLIIFLNIKIIIIEKATVKAVGKDFFKTLGKKSLFISSLDASSERINPGIPIVIEPIKVI